MLLSVQMTNPQNVKMFHQLSNIEFSNEQFKPTKEITHELSRQRHIRYVPKQ